MLSLTELKLDRIPIGYQALGAVCGLGVAYLTMRSVLRKGIKPETETTLVPGGREMSGDEWLMNVMDDLGVFTNCYVHFVESKLPVTKELVTKAAKMIRARHPLLRMRIDDICDKRGKVRHYFVPMEDEIVDVEMIDKSDWQDVHTAELMQSINSKTGPLWRIRVMPNSKENEVYETILFVSFNHTIIDGNVMMQFIDQLLSYMSSIVEGNEDLPESLPMVPHAYQACAISTITWWEWLKFKLVVLLVKWHNPGNAYLAKFGAEISHNPTAKKETCVIPIEFNQQKTSKILDMSRRNKSTVSGTLASASAVAIAQIMQDGVLKSAQTIPTTFAVDTRRLFKPPLEASKTFAIYSPFMDTPLDMKVEANAKSSDAFWRLAADYTKQTHALVANGIAMTNLKGTQFLQDEGYSIHKLVQPTFDDDKNGNRFGDGIFFLSNLGNLSYFTRPTPRVFELTRRHCACEMSKFGCIYCHYVCSFHGRLFWSLTYYSHVTSREKAQEYANLITEVIAEMCEF